MLATHVFHYAHFEFDLSNTLAAKDWGKKKKQTKKRISSWNVLVRNTSGNEKIISVREPEVHIQ